MMAEKTYYHLSFMDMGAKRVFKPRKYKGLGMAWELISGANDIRKICVAPTIEGCIYALGFSIRDLPRLHVYKTRARADKRTPKKLVDDAGATGEAWIYEPTQFEKIGVIRATSNGECKLESKSRKFQVKDGRWIWGSFQFFTKLIKKPKYIWINKN